MAKKKGRKRNADGLYTATIELPPDPATGKRRRKYVRATTIAALNKKVNEVTRLLIEQGDIRTSVPTVAVYMRRWIDHTMADEIKPRTRATYRSYIERHIIPAIGRRRLDHLTPTDIVSIADAIRSKGLSTTTALQAHVIMQRALRDAKAEGFVRANAADDARRPKVAVTKQAVLSVEDAVKVLRAHQGQERLRLAVAFMLGVRQGEALGMTWEHVTLYRDGDGRVTGGEVELAWALQRLPRTVGEMPAGQEGERVKGGLWLVRPKSRRGWRRLPLPAPLARDLAAQWDGVGGRWVFPGPDGGPIDPRADSRAWEAALATAGVEYVPLHSARHTTATLLRALGVPEDVRMQILGHSSATTTAGYTHLDLTEAADGLDRLAGLLLPG
jgi:integrase